MSLTTRQIQKMLNSPSTHAEASKMLATANLILAHAEEDAKATKASVTKACHSAWSICDTVRVAKLAPSTGEAGYTLPYEVASVRDRASRLYRFAGFLP